MSIHGDNTTSFHQNTLIQPIAQKPIPILHPLPSDQSSFVQIELPDPDSPPIATIASVSAEPAAACIAHPHFPLTASLAILIQCLFAKRAVVVGVVVSTADGQDALVDERVAESAVEPWSGGVFGLFACLRYGELVDVAVFRKGNVDKGHVHVMVCVSCVFWRMFQALSGGPEPVNLILFDPVIAPKLSFVGRVAVGVEHVEGYGRMGAATAREYLYIVVSDTIDVFGANMR